MNNNTSAYIIRDFVSTTMKNYNNNYKNYNNTNKNQSSNQFSTTTTTIVQKKPDTNNIVEFPTLVGDGGVVSNNTTSLDFKTASLKELKQEEKKEELKAGWTSYTVENGRMKKAGYQKEYYEQPFSVKAKRIIGIMVERWDRYKENYIDLYGEDTYHKMYSFPRKYQDDDDSCTENEKGENEDENEDYNDEYDDYY